MRVALVKNAGTGSSHCSMHEARFPIGLGDLSAMLTRVEPATVWKNLRNGTWSGRSDRRVQSRAAEAARKPGRQSAPGEAEPWRAP